ncbi:MAG: hypothetical protein AAFP86_18610, partial [Planctomycetota bacterium]
ELTAVPHEADAGLLELLYDRPRVEVRLLASDGSAWAGPIRSGRPARSVTMRRETVEAARVDVVPTRVVAGRSVVDLDDPFNLVPGREAVDGVLRVDVPRGVEYFVVVRGGGSDQSFPPRPVAVRIEPGETRVEVVAQAVDDRGFGAVRIDARVRRREFDPFTLSFGEEPAPGGDAMPHVPLDGSSFVVVEDPATGVVVAIPRRGADGFLEARLPAGEYVVRVGWAPGRRPTYGEFHPAPHGGASARFTVESGATTDVRIEAGAGGCIEVENRLGSEATLFAIDADGRRLSLLRSDEDASGGTAGFVDRFPPGSSHRTVPVPAGDWRVVGSCSGHAIERRVRVVDRETARLVIE